MSDEISALNLPANGELMSMANMANGKHEVWLRPDDSDCI